MLWSAALTALITAGLHTPLAQAQTSSGNDCDSNAVIWCGADTVPQLTDRFNNGDGHNSTASIHAIYSFFGINPSDISNMGGNPGVQHGVVTKSGNVFDAHGRLIATDAMTGGRQDMAGSTRVNSGGATFFTRPPSVSFQQNSLSAIIVMHGGRFSFAILSSCGNPVKATPKVAPAPKPTPAPTPAPAAPQPAPCSGNTSNTATNSATNGAAGSAQGGNCSTNVVNNTVTTSGTPTCDMVGISQGDNRTVTINNFTTTANGGTFSSADINWGDGTSATSVTNPIGQTHQFNSDGTFTISVVAHFQVNGQTVSADGNVCQQQVSFNTPAPTVPAPTATPASAPAQQLVNTGPGDVFGIFTLTTILSTLSYRFWLRRYLGQQG